MAIAAIAANVDEPHALPAAHAAVAESPARVNLAPEQAPLAEQAAGVDRLLDANDWESGADLALIPGRVDLYGAERSGSRGEEVGEAVNQLLGHGVPPSHAG
jgi:hypothetical protein